MKFIKIMKFKQFIRICIRVAYYQWYGKRLILVAMGDRVGYNMKTMKAFLNFGGKEEVIYEKYQRMEKDL